MQEESLRGARLSVELTTNRYRAGLVAFTEVVTVQAVAFSAERAAVDLAGRRLVAAVNLFKALGGGYGTPDAAPSASR